MKQEDSVRYGYVWSGQKPIQLDQPERRNVSDPYCPYWCPYTCTGLWKTGYCHIRIPEATMMLKEA